jgi:hypothetical protein
LVFETTNVNQEEDSPVARVSLQRRRDERRLPKKKIPEPPEVCA